MSKSGNARGCGARRVLRSVQEIGPDEIVSRRRLPGQAAAHEELGETGGRLVQPASRTVAPEQIAVLRQIGDARTLQAVQKLLDRQVLPVRHLGRGLLR